MASFTVQAKGDDGVRARVGALAEKRGLQLITANKAEPLSLMVVPKAYQS